VLSCGHVFLTGFSGSGKSIVGCLLASRLKRRFADTDRIVERLAGKSVREIFRLHGETRFRKIEREAIARLIQSKKPPLVVALGGGALMSAATRRMVKAAGCIVYLSCSQRELYRRVRNLSDRPLLDLSVRKRGCRCEIGLASISHLLTQRLPGYQMADIKCSTTSRTPRQVVREIIEQLEKCHGSC
jgi:shikimate kinase